MLGCILTRHVTSKETNNLWVHAVQKMQEVYPDVPIVIIDDNSDYSCITEESVDMRNVVVVQSEYPKRGELLPYYYFLKHKWFPRAVILHDAVFVHERCAEFDAAENRPLWHFLHPINNDFKSEQEMLATLKNPEVLLSIHAANSYRGMFGVMAAVELEFMEALEETYGFSELVHIVKDRSARMSLERVMGVLFVAGHQLKNRPPPESIFGNIHHYCRWGITFEQYMQGEVQRPLTKVWSER